MRAVRYGVPLLVAATLALSLAGPLPVTAAQPAAAQPAAAHDGAGVRLRPCSVAPRARCGVLERAWDPDDPSLGTVRIGFALIPRADAGAARAGTVLAQEGGPGYSTTGSADLFTDMLGPVLDDHDLLLVDQRGTGLSEPVDCPAVQHGYGSFDRAARACARRLGPRAHLLGTALAVDDTAAVVAALGLGPVDFYGDSYGTFFGQVLAVRHPHLLRRVVLDGAYPVTGESAWYPTQGPALAESLTVVCARSPACAGVGGAPLQRLETLLQRLRTRGPLTGRVRGSDGRRHRVVLDPAALVTVAYNATYVPTTYIELDAAVRAGLAGDRLPLLRLAAEAGAGTAGSGGGARPVSARPVGARRVGTQPVGVRGGERWFSAGQELAVSCQDYPHLFDLAASPATRWRQYQAAVATMRAEQPGLYAPFRIGEYLASGWGGQDWCWNWPAAPSDRPPGPPVPPDSSYPAVPTLVLSGELDTITTPAEGRMVAARFPAATTVVVANGLHVTALDDHGGCVRGIVRAFLSGATVDPTCAARAAPLVTARPFARTWREADPADPVAGGTVPVEAARRAATAAVDTVADAIDRWWQSARGSGPGLRGGTWSARGDTVVRLTLRQYVRDPGLRVSGRVRWDRRTGAIDGELDLRTGDAVANGRVAIERRAGGAGTTSVHGTLGGEPVDVAVPD